jgi:hypothetical protein
MDGDRIDAGAHQKGGKVCCWRQLVHDRVHRLCGGPGEPWRTGVLTDRREGARSFMEDIEPLETRRP